MRALLGLGTYRTQGVVEAAEAALQFGVDWVDTAPNYQHGQAETRLAPFLKAYGGIRVSTKVGFVAGPQQDEAVQAGVLSEAEAGSGFSLDPRYVTWQVARSAAALGRCPDITFVHNPEHGDPAPTALAERVEQAFRALEKCCDQGLIHGYGVATWSALHDGSLTVPGLIDLARAAGGPFHRLRAVQLPLSLIQLGPIADAIDGHGVLAEAQSAGLAVFASAPLGGGELPEFITPAAAEELLPGVSPSGSSLARWLMSLG